MPVIAVTRLRLRDPALVEEFLRPRCRAGAGGELRCSLGADVLANANNARWTLPAWLHAVRAVHPGKGANGPHLPPPAPQPG